MKTTREDADGYPIDETYDRVILYGRERDTRGIADAAGWTRQPHQTRWGLGRADRPDEWIALVYDGSWQHARSVQDGEFVRTVVLAEGPNADSLATHLAHDACARTAARAETKTWTWPDGRVTQTTTLVAPCPAGCGDIALWAGPYAPAGSVADRYAPHRHPEATYRCWWSDARAEDA